MFKGPYHVGDAVFQFIADAAQTWADEPSATIVDADGEQIPEEVIEDILGW